MQNFLHRTFHDLVHGLKKYFRDCIDARFEVNRLRIATTIGSVCWASDLRGDEESWQDAPLGRSADEWLCLGWSQVDRSLIPPGTVLFIWYEAAAGKLYWNLHCGAHRDDTFSYEVSSGMKVFFLCISLSSRYVVTFRCKTSSVYSTYPKLRDVHVSALISGQVLTSGHCGLGGGTVVQFSWFDTWRTTYSQWLELGTWPEIRALTCTICMPMWRMCVPQCCSFPCCLLWVMHRGGKASRSPEEQFFIVHRQNDLYWEFGTSNAQLTCTEGSISSLACQSVTMSKKYVLFSAVYEWLSVIAASMYTARQLA